VSAAETPRRTVPLEAGISPDNPPCPVCGEPLFGWATLPSSGVGVRRCETCSVGIAGDPPTKEEVIADLEAAGGRVANRSSLIAWIGVSGWAGIELHRKVLFSRDAVRRLGRTPRARPAFALAAQSLLNSFTFGHNIGLGWFGRGESTPAAEVWQRRVDAGITVLASPVVLLAATLIELIGSAFGRGGSVTFD
jgi:hypothetical protein